MIKDLIKINPRNRKSHKIDSMTFVKLFNETMVVPDGTFLTGHYEKRRAKNQISLDFDRK
jgi:hypothetical protein